ncbi:MAG: TrkA C-terminal domain-containing protein, partial [Oscillospiraceae bacterium]|nr:TrkA C-terminal domain-containing protein [Oscillospiraceae bacterium]
FMNGSASGGNFVLLVLPQLVFGLLFGVAIAATATLFIKRMSFSAGFDGIFLVAVAILAYSLPTLVDGNGYLSVYMTGIILGNCKIDNKQGLVHFFDGITGLMQMILFFLLGLLSFPSHLPSVILPALALALFLTFVARPIAVSLLSIPFKWSIKQLAVISWSGMRGAASIVFAILTVIDSAFTQNDIFHIVFFIVLFSILVQGTLIPVVSKKLDMTDDSSDVMKTFTDYVDEFPVQYIQFAIPENHAWAGKKVKDLELPPDCLLVLVIRDGNKHAPRGNTVINSGDIMILSGKASEHIEGINLYEKNIDEGDEWQNKTIHEIPSGEKLIIMVRRGEHAIIPRGNTKLLKDDILVINELSELSH